MIRRLLTTGLLISALGMMPARNASAGFVTAIASGPGGTVSNLAIGTTATPNDTVNFDTDFTSNARIVFTLTVDGPGLYFLGVENGSITNSTAAALSNLSADLLTAPAGTNFFEAGYHANVFSSVSFNSLEPNVTGVTFNGPPGLGAGDTTFINLGFQVTATGTSTIEISLSPSSVVPEPSSLALCGIAILTGLAVARVRRKRT